MSRNGHYDLLEANGLLDVAMDALFVRYEAAKRDGSVQAMLTVLAEAQLLQMQMQLRMLAGSRDLVALTGWPAATPRPRQVVVGTTATRIEDLEGGERTVVDLYIFDPSPAANASPVAFGGPGVTFNQGYIQPAGVILPPLALIESLYAVAQTGSTTVSVRRRG